MEKTISICIPCYKHERYIRTTIESALCQTVPANEILISDDRSPDRSLEIIKEYAHIPRVRIMQPPQRTTLGGHYRFLLEQATSDYICFLSSDDALMPTFVETMQRELGDEENIGLISGACLETNERLIPKRIRGSGAPSHTLPPPEGFNFISRGLYYTISFSIMSRQILMEAPVIPPAGDHMTDWYWALILGARGKFKFVRKPIGYYRIHSSNAGHDQEEAQEKASIVMLEFLIQYLGSELGQKLQPRLEGYRKRLESRRRGAPVVSGPRSFKTRVKDIMKSAVALRYSKLPASLQKAEQGISLTLTTRNTA